MAYVSGETSAHITSGAKEHRLAAFPVLILPKLPALEPLKVCWQIGFCTQTLAY